jgi:hypothetical protein
VAILPLFLLSFPDLLEMLYERHVHFLDKPPEIVEMINVIDAIAFRKCVD